jgi:hypothetical protein
MLMHSDRRMTPQWAKSGPPQGVGAGSPPDGVTSLVRATSPTSAPFLADELPAPITVCKCGRFWV